MTERTDHELLAEFARSGSDAAFAALVARHVNLVYSAALRATRQPDHAQEITQAVFIILARKAGKLSPRVVLSSWLYQTARLTAANFLKAEIRRQHREQEAYMQSTLNDESQAAAWEQLAPHLEAAMGGLGETDRNTLVLRFFENKTAAEAAPVLNLTEAAAHKRTARALDKLRGLLARRGVMLTATVLAGALSANSVQAAPIGLAATVSLTTTTGGLAAPTIISLANQTLKTIMLHKLQFAAATTAALLLAAGTTTMLAGRDAKDTMKTPVLPYVFIDMMRTTQQGINPTNLVLNLQISSTNRVRMKDVHLSIQSTNLGVIQLRLDKDGQILNWPDNEELRQENPPVFSDQPEGSLMLRLSLNAVVPKELTFRYQRLWGYLDELKKLPKQNQGGINLGFRSLISKDANGYRPNVVLPESSARKATLSIKAAEGVKIFVADSNVLLNPKLQAANPPSKDAKGHRLDVVFPESSARKATLSIQAADGVKTFTADGNGIIRLRLNPELQAENPLVVLSEKPERMQIVW